MRILSGINPSSAKGLHIGNYFGMVKPALELQKEAECFYFIADIHSLNTVFDPKIVRENSLNIFAEFIALGLDPDKTVFFIESDIPEITYLQTILNNVVTIAELKRMHAYKDKLAQDIDQDAISMGLFSYPVLMAADILLFDTNIVPVGEDQVQHVEICREIARSFNNRYGALLTVPEASVRKTVSRIVGIDGVRKMSKSLGNDIPIFGSEETIRKQIISIKTDPARIHPTDPGDPEKNISFSYLKLLNYDEHKRLEMEDKYRKGTIGDVAIKQVLFEHFMTEFKSVRALKEELMQHPSLLLKLKTAGAHKARRVARQKLDKILTAVGFSHATDTI